MKVWVSLFLLGLVFSILPCSGTEAGNNAATPVVKDVNIREKQLPSNSESEVSSRQQNQTKKGGWQVPPRNKQHIVDISVNTLPTEDGKDVEVTRTHYSFDPPWPYTEDFLDLSGPLKLETHFVMEHSRKGKAFMYSIFAKRVLSRPPSNNEPHEDTFVYLIQDKDGDGIFETLPGDFDKIIVPKWVLR